MGKIGNSGLTDLPEALKICIASTIKNRYGDADMNMKAYPASVSVFQDHEFGALLFNKRKHCIDVIRSNPCGCCFAHGKTVS
jgi:hypothetical protein